MNDMKIKMYSFTIDCKNPSALAQFYAKLLDWEVVFQTEEFACVGAKGMAQGAYPGLTFQKNEAYEPPVWPEEVGKQQQMAHLDFAVNDLEKAKNHALSCGATIAPKQFSDGWIVMIDKEGHPFCLCQMKEMMESPTFALL